MAQKNISSITPVKDPCISSVYELSRKIDSLCKVVKDVSEKISELEDTNILDLHKKIENQDQHVKILEEKIKSLEQKLQHA
jgi:chromosome segregation ATPase